MGDNLEVRLLTKDTAWDSILQDIEREQHKIRFQTFLWRDDQLGRRIAQALLDACKRGCEVAVVYDSKALPHALAEFSGRSFWDAWYSSELGLQLKSSIYALCKGRDPIIQTGNPLRSELLKHPNFRLIRLLDCEVLDHRKWISLYGSGVNYIGGMNVGDEYASTWHDFMLRIDSFDFHERLLRMHWNIENESFSLDSQLHPVANFVGDWNFPWRLPLEFLGRSIPFVPILGEISPAKYYRFVERVPKRELRDAKGLLETVESLILQERERVRIFGGYLNSKSICASLLTVLGDGVEVEIILPENPNIQGPTMGVALKYFTSWVNTEGVGDNLHIYLSPEMIHAKSIQVGSKGNQRTYIGSGNFDAISSFFSGELGVVVGPEFADVQSEFEQYFLDVRSRSRKVVSLKDLDTSFLTSLKGFSELYWRWALYGKCKRSVYSGDVERLRSVTRQRYAY